MRKCVWNLIMSLKCKIMLLFRQKMIFIYSNIFLNSNTMHGYHLLQKVHCCKKKYKEEPHSRRWNIHLNLYFHLFVLVSKQSAALSSAIQHAMPPEFGREWGTECLNTRFPLPTLLRAGYSVNLIWFLFFNYFLMQNVSIINVW